MTEIWRHGYIDTALVALFAAWVGWILGRRSGRKQMLAEHAHYQRSLQGPMMRDYKDHESYRKAMLEYVEPAIRELVDRLC